MTVKRKKPVRGWLPPPKRSPSALAKRIVEMEDGESDTYELQRFRTLLPDAKVTRAEHMLDGAGRCAYQVVPR